MMHVRSSHPHTSRWTDAENNHTREHRSAPLENSFVAALVAVDALVVSGMRRTLIEFLVGTDVEDVIVDIGTRSMNQEY